MPRDAKTTLSGHTQAEHRDKILVTPGQCPLHLYIDLYIHTCELPTVSVTLMQPQAMRCHTHSLHLCLH
jgi:hypothetical protein